MVAIRRKRPELPCWLNRELRKAGYCIPKGTDRYATVFKEKYALQCYLFWIRVILNCDATLKKYKTS